MCALGGLASGEMYFVSIFFLWGDYDVALSHFEPPNQTVNVLYKYCLELHSYIYIYLAMILMFNMNSLLTVVLFHVIQCK